MQLRNILLMVAIASIPAAAAKQQPIADAGQCAPVVWPYDRSQSGLDHQKIFLLTPRPLLENYFLGELTAEGLKPSAVSYDLARFLIDTESNDKKKGFYDLLRWGADLFGRTSKPLKMKIENICEMRRKILGK